jgi:cytochrome bd-I ubiquinol oxidase subunit X
MWYFTWVLGVAAALALGIINVMWYEAQDVFVPDDIEDDVNHDGQQSPSTHI